jgi:CheY-like chemotaxis protein
MAFGRERELIARHVRHLVRLVDDLLDVSRIIRGKVQLERVRCRVSEVILEAVEMASPLLVERAHELTLPPDQGLEISADRVRVAQAIANLLVNAAKYTEPGGSITVDVRVDGHEAVIGVRDSGNGISPEVLPKIFDLFVQGASSLDRAHGGMGIGLTVVRRVVELHGGSVSARSEGLGRGSEFAIRLPLAREEVSEPAAATPASDRPKGTLLRALVVDDNEDAADLMGEALRLLGCSVQVAHNGASALEAWSAVQADLVLLDIGLPDIDGYELARRLRRSHDGGSTRIVAITGYGQESDRLRSQEAGFSEHLVKPVDLEDLKGVLLRCGEAGAMHATPPPDVP